MTKYITQKKQIAEWILKTLDNQPQDLQKFFALASLQGFKLKDVTSIMGNYMLLGEIYFSTEKGVIYSLKVPSREIQLNGELEKRDVYK